MRGGIAERERTVRGDVFRGLGGGVFVCGWKGPGGEGRDMLCLALFGVGGFVYSTDSFLGFSEPKL